MTPPVRSFDLEVNGVRLRCQDWGGSGAPILILHATSFLSLLYWPIAQALTAIGHVLSYDQRGHGDSSRAPDAAYDWDHQYADLLAVVEALDLKGLHGLGHSAGATLLATLSGDRPERVARLTMVEPVLTDKVSTGSIASAMVQRTLRRRPSFESAQAMYANFENKPPYDSWRKELLHDYCEHGAARDLEGQWRLKCPPEIEASFYASVGRFATLDRAMACKAPALMILGGRESTGAANASRFAAAVPATRIETVPGAGHLIAMENPELVARMALEFFAEP